MDFQKQAQDVNLYPATNQAIFGMKPGSRYVVHTVPGWIFVGTVVTADEHKLVLSGAKYIEGLAPNNSCFGLAACTNQEQFNKVSPVHYDIPGEINVSGGRVVLFVQCAEQEG